MLIYLVRHGETEWNAAGRFQGREDVPLNDNGIIQAGALAAGFLGKDVRLIVSSPLIRARQTAQIISELFPGAEFHLDEGLIERDLGSLSGLEKAERLKLREKGPVMDMEPLCDVMKRMYGALCRAADAADERRGRTEEARDRQRCLAECICADAASQDTTTDNVVKDTMMFGGKWHMDASEIRFARTEPAQAELNGPCVILVSHGAAINALLSLLSCGDIGSGRTILRNACVSIVHEEAEGFRVLDYDIV